MTVTVTYEAVVGLEIHAQLTTRSKLFCACTTDFGAAPNHHTCEVCLGMPGVLPVLNHRAVELATQAAMALKCTLHERSSWARKHYFYPDLPKGYQITQHPHPIATDGTLRIDDEGIDMQVRIARVHIEEDAGKTVHMAGHTHRTAIDLNRCGVPLIEIVSEPDFRSGEQAAAYMKTLRRLLRYLGVCNGNMEQGNFRCDANVSVRAQGTPELGTRTELKNINSFKFVKQAIGFEIERQIAMLSAGEAVVRETRYWDRTKKETQVLRGKEEARDYRYMPEPDLPTLQLEPDVIAKTQKKMPELPDAKRRRFQEQFGLSDYDARVLCEEAEIAAFFERAVTRHDNPKGVANWIINDLLRTLKEVPLESVTLTPAHIAELVRLIDDGTISTASAKMVFAEMLACGAQPTAIVTDHGLQQLTDQAAIADIVDRVLAEHLNVVADYRAGNTTVLGKLIGQVMQATRGKANPQMARSILVRKLEQ